MEDQPTYNYHIDVVKTSLLKLNTGQVLGLPANPRFIRDQKYKDLVKSIEENPTMLELREPIVYDNNGELVVIAGNMRLRACRELKIDKLKVKIVEQDTPAKVLREITIKDNLGYGEDDWDILSNTWDTEELEGWGVEPPFHNDDIDFSEVKGNQDRETSKQTREFICPNCSEKFEV
jgi:ParB-like chromosome segregation protein Spo0J